MITATKPGWRPGRFPTTLPRHLCLTLGLCAISVAVADEPLVLLNATVYTVDAERRVAEALAIDADGLILDVGTTTSIQQRYGDGIDLQGAMVLPGFQDVHLHAVEAGVTAEFCLLPQFGTAEDYRAELDQCAGDQYGWDWVMGAGVNMAALLEAVDNPRALADSIISDRPLLVLDDLGHGAWGNTLALQAAGFDDLEGSPAGGILVRDDAGKLNGVVLESSAQVLVDAAQSAPEWVDFASVSFENALQEFARHGITSVSDAGGYWPRNHEQVWRQASTDATLTVRANNALYVYPDRDPDAQIAELLRRFRQSRQESQATPSATDATPTVRFNQAKLYVDGILSQHTGLVDQAYEQSSGLPLDSDTGFAYFDKAVLFRYARELSAAGIQLHFHTTGDAGTTLALDAIEQAIQQADADAGPHRITHLYLVNPADYPRFAELGVVADFQIAPSSVDSDYLDSMSALIGDRVARLMPLHDLHRSGATITVSSDWDADEISPLIKLRTLLTRPRQGVETLADAIEMLTINPAYLLQHDATTGSIEVGKFADLVILSDNLFELQPSEFDQVEVLATLLAGDAVYDPQALFE